MTNELIKYLIEQSSGIVIALILILRVDRRMDKLTSSINHLTELISGTDLIHQYRDTGQIKDTTNFQIDENKEGDQNNRPISKPAEIRKQA